MRQARVSTDNYYLYTPTVRPSVRLSCKMISIICSLKMFILKLLDVKGDSILYVKCRGCIAMNVGC